MCLIFPGLIHGMHEGELKHNGPFKASHHMVRLSPLFLPASPGLPLRFQTHLQPHPFPHRLCSSTNPASKTLPTTASPSSPARRVKDP